jgi:hypothetical protein
MTYHAAAAAAAAPASCSLEAVCFFITDVGRLHSQACQKVHCILLSSASADGVHSPRWDAGSIVHLMRSLTECYTSPKTQLISILQARSTQRCCVKESDGSAGYACSKCTATAAGDQHDGRTGKSPCLPMVSPCKAAYGKASCKPRWCQSCRPANTEGPGQVVCSAPSCLLVYGTTVV